MLIILYKNYILPQFICIAIGIVTWNKCGREPSWCQMCGRARGHILWFICKWNLFVKSDDLQPLSLVRSLPHPLAGKQAPNHKTQDKTPTPPRRSRGGDKLRQSYSHTDTARI